MEPVPLAGLAANFSPMPRMAPPPLGNEICGAVNGAVSGLAPLRSVRAMSCFSATQPSLRSVAVLDSGLRIPPYHHVAPDTSDLEFQNRLTFTFIFDFAEAIP